MRPIALYCLLVLVVCAIPAAPAVSQRGDADLDRAWEHCQARIAASPEYRALKDKIGAHAVQAMLSSTAKATPQEAAQVQILHRDHVVPCRQIERETARRHNPSLLTILDAAYAKSDANFARLIGYQITWGQFTRDSEAIKAERDDQWLKAQSSGLPRR